MSVRDRLSVVSAVAVLLAASALRPVFDTLAWVPRTVGVVLVVTLASALARRLRLPRALAPLLPLLALAAYLAAVFAAGSLRLGLLPGPATVRALHALLEASGTDLSQYGPPAPATSALVLLVVGGVGLVAVAVDTLASVGERPAAAGLPLLALFAVPSALLPGGLGWLPFALGAAGWLALLLVQSSADAARWGTSLRTTPGTDGAGLGRIGRRIGGAALGVAVLVPALVPGLNTRLLTGGSGDGSGSESSHSITTYNPITRLRGELTLPQPTEVLRYRTDDADPDYLRMTTLGVYDGSGWRQDVLRGNLRDDGVDDPIPTPLGQTASAATRAVHAQISIASLDAFWLPVPSTPTDVQVNGPWMWDAGSASIFSTRSNTSKVHSYTVTAARVLPDPASLNAQNDLPAQIQPYAASVTATPYVRALTASIIKGQTTAYGKAAALQAFFRSPANDFVYTEQTSTGGSPDALQDFLKERRGFCEQYASAMGAMLRLAGVPSRVAVGFTSGTLQPDGTRVVTTSEAHAWPEAWFDGAGWVRFEPTPSRGGINDPAYATPPVAGVPTTTTPGASAAPADPGAVAGETAEQRRERVQSEREDRSDAVVGTAAGSTSGGGHAARDAGVAGAVVLLLALPALLHLARRRRRWHTPLPRVAWDQLRDDAADTGYAWRSAESPRAAGVRLGDETGLPDSARAAIGRLTSAVERARYAPAGSGEDGSPRQLLSDSAAVRSALRAGTPWTRRVRSVLLPPSTLHRITSRAGSRTADLLDGGDRLVSAAGARLRRRSA